MSSVTQLIPQLRTSNPMGVVRLCIRLPLVALIILTCLALMAISTFFGGYRFNRRVERLGFRLGAAVMNVHIHTQGELAQQRPLLLISNHFSYIDLFAIGSHVTAAFTPKSEIAGWPIIGTLCKMAGCCFIDRRPSKTLANKKVLDDATQRGEVISLFPEGTTNEGYAILPFKSSYFSLAENTDISVQPMTVVYTHLNNKPMTREALPVIGWYGPAYLFPHLVTFLKQKNCHVTLVFHPAVNGRDFASRKELALYCKEQIERSYFELMPEVQKPAVH